MRKPSISSRTAHVLRELSAGEARKTERDQDFDSKCQHKSLTKLTCTKHICALWGESCTDGNILTWSYLEMGLASTQP